MMVLVKSQHCMNVILLSDLFTFAEAYIHYFLQCNIYHNDNVANWEFRGNSRS